MADLAFLTALKSWTELGLHTKGALRNGLTEIREAILQSIIYCGAPAGMEAMRVTEKAIQEYKAEASEDTGQSGTFKTQSQE
jgi:4-carboxymuconolactone decarboxylase